MTPSIQLPREKVCDRCKHVKPFTEFYIVPSYRDNLSRLCKPCNTDDTRERSLRRQLKNKGAVQFQKTIDQHRRLADLMETILNENR